MLEARRRELGRLRQAIPARVGMQVDGCIPHRCCCQAALVRNLGKVYVRRQHLRCLQFLQVLLFATPTLAAVFSFAAYGSAEPNNFTPNHIFSAIAYFSIMRFPLVCSTSGSASPECLPLSVLAFPVVFASCAHSLQRVVIFLPCRCSCLLRWCSSAMPWCPCGASTSTWSWRSAQMRSVHHSSPCCQVCQPLLCNLVAYQGGHGLTEQVLPHAGRAA